ncbi:LuxR C-terminal-related transcriptional regulator [Streptomyces sp. G1]|uniref:LuxR C-terminal-related transcriptional regulator n=1 Tax=Streptomyces sp. G1 TaxID=361572 RepID=UPI00202DBD1B|nr:LuxR C-terminal-related transcriptional regulator [Streptomyces sp. G1]MCM1976805.1 LuxR C-terminal-related transcriptional regulator [Streptomyces sp. G1]
MTGLNGKKLAQAGLVLPRSARPGQAWAPRTPAEEHLLREAQRLDRIRLLLLEELGRARAEAGQVRVSEKAAAAARAAERLKGCPLPPAQLNAVAAAAAGESVHATARRLSLSWETVRSHRQRALRRLGARDMEHAVQLCTAAGWITPEHASAGVSQ